MEILITFKANLKRTIVIVLIILFPTTFFSETIPALGLENYEVDEFFHIDYYDQSAEEPTLSETCTKIQGCYWGYHPGRPNDGPACWNSAFNRVPYKRTGICLYGPDTSHSPMGLCIVDKHCPNPSWTLSENKQSCSRPDFSCVIRVNEMSEEKLLAGIAYGEASTKNIYEEMAGIASATLRRRDASRLGSVNDFVKKNPNFSYVITDGNERFRKLVCSEMENGFELAYKAARNALNGGEDFSNGGCFWDGYDIKTSGSNHIKYKYGFKFSDSNHNIYGISEPPLKERQGSKGVYNVTYESTAAIGRTIFWKLNSDFLKARGAKQCI